MQCADLAELVSAYADDQLVPAQREFIEAHLSVCSSCNGKVRRMLETRRLFQSIVDDDWTPPDMRLRIAHAIQKPPTRARAVLFSGLISVAATILVLLAVVHQIVAGYSTMREATAPVLPATGICTHCAVQRARQSLAFPVADRYQLLASSGDAAAPQHDASQATAQMSIGSQGTKGGEGARKHPARIVEFVPL